MTTKISRPLDDDPTCEPSGWIFDDEPYLARRSFLHLVQEGYETEAEYEPITAELLVGLHTHRKPPRRRSPSDYWGIDKFYADLAQSKAQEKERLRQSVLFLLPEDRLRSEFDQLIRQWKEDTSHLSVAMDAYMHPAYQRIIGMGPQVIPIILAEIEHFPYDWFWALRCVSGQDPASSADSVEEAVMSWIKWGKDRGYIE